MTNRSLQSAARPVPALICCLSILAAGCGEDIRTLTQSTEPAAADVTIRSALGGPIWPLIMSTSPKPDEVDWDSFFDSMSSLLDTVKSIASDISGPVGAVTAAISVLKLLGIIDSVDQVDQLATTVKNIAIGATWQISQSYIDTTFTGIKGAMDTLDTYQRSGMTYTFDSPGYQNSVDGVGGLTLASAWNRTAVGSVSDDAATNGTPLDYQAYGFGTTPVTMHIGWKTVVPGRPANTGGNNVFDWRQGAPLLLKAIALRLLVIQAVDPNFRTDHFFEQELRETRDALLAQYNTMSLGIQCASKDFVYTNRIVNGQPINRFGCNMVCADIYTGISALASVTPPPGFTPADTSARCTNISSTKSYFSMQDGLVAQVRGKLPLFEMRAMIDLLYTFLHPGFDLAQPVEEIASNAAPGSCFDVSAGNMVLQPCNGAASQRWTYDRSKRRLFNPALQQCLGSGVVYFYGEPTFSLSCPATDSWSTMWTYDPEHHMLINGLGLTLTGSNLVTAGAPIVTEGPYVWLVDDQHPNGFQRMASGFISPMRHVAGDETWGPSALPANPTWVPIGGLASGVGSGWVLGLGPDGNGNSGIFRWDPAAQNWPATSGRAKTITVDLNGLPWVVTAAGQIFKWDGRGWSTFGGVGTFCATSVTSGSTDTETWATKCGDNSIWKWNGDAWIQQPGAALKVAMVSTADPTCDDHLPMVIGLDNNVYFFKHADCSTGDFYPNGSAVDLATDLAVGTDGNVWRWNAVQSAWNYYTTPPADWGTNTRIGGWGQGTFAISSISGAIQMLQ